MERDMKYMILTYASQQDYDGMAGETGSGEAWSPEDFTAMTAFMEGFNTELADSGELVETRALAAPVRLPSYAATATSTLLKMPCRMPCSRLQRSGRTRAFRTTRRAG
jgi:hypothetical protein